MLSTRTCANLRGRRRKFLLSPPTFLAFYFPLLHPSSLSFSSLMPPSLSCDGNKFYCARRGTSFMSSPSLPLVFALTHPFTHEESMEENPSIYLSLWAPSLSLTFFTACFFAIDEREERRERKQERGEKKRKDKREGREKRENIFYFIFQVWPKVWPKRFGWERFDQDKLRTKEAKSTIKKCSKLKWQYLMSLIMLGAEILWAWSSIQDLQICWSCFKFRDENFRVPNVSLYASLIG